VPVSTLYDVTCSECGAETAVAETVWPATRHDPADGETSPEECPGCGHPFGQSDEWREAEPPEPDHHYERAWARGEDEDV
jgi:hypothetical protein